MKKFGKRDLILIGVILIIAGLVWLFYQVRTPGAGAYAVVTVDGELYGKYSLEEEQMVDIKANGKVTNQLVIKDHKADMKDADCPDKLCVHQKAVSKSGESIVCLPNKVVVTVESDEKSEFDSMAR